MNLSDADTDLVFGGGPLRMAAGEHVEVDREAAVPGEPSRYAKRFLDGRAGDFRPWAPRERQILERLGRQPGAPVARLARGLDDPDAVHTWDAGPTVDQWATRVVLRRDGRLLGSIFEDCAGWWSLARQCLVALDTLHGLGVVHCDLKADNVCIPWSRPGDPARPVPGQPLGPRFGRLAFIDLAWAVVPGIGLPGPLPLDRDPDYQYQSPRLVRAFEESRRGNDEALAEVDWRTDFYALGAMLWLYLPELERSHRLGWTAHRHDQASTLVRLLVGAEAAVLPELRPHADLIAMADTRLREPELAAALEAGTTFDSERAVPAGAEPTPKTRIARIAGDRAGARRAVPVSAAATATPTAGPAAASPPPRWPERIEPTLAPLPPVASAGSASREPSLAAPEAERPIDRSPAPPAPAPNEPSRAAVSPLPTPGPSLAAPAIPPLREPSQAAPVVPPLREPSQAAPAIPPPREPSRAATALPPPREPSRAAPAPPDSPQPRPGARTSRAVSALAGVALAGIAAALWWTLRDDVRMPFDRGPASAGASQPASTPPLVVATAPSTDPASPATSPAAASAAATDGPPTRPAPAAAASPSVAEPAAPALPADAASSPTATSLSAAPPDAASAAASSPAGTVSSAPPSVTADAGSNDADTGARNDADVRAASPSELTAIADQLMRRRIPRLAEAASRQLAPVLAKAAEAHEMRQAPAVRSAARNARFGKDRPSLDVSVRSAQARTLNEAARVAYYRRDNVYEAVRLQTRAFGANPLDTEVVGNLAFYSLRERPPQAEAARELALHALTIKDPRFPSGRVEDWTTFAIASALTGRDADARNAWFMTMVVSNDLQRHCQNAVRALTLYGERLRPSVQAMLQRARSSAGYGGCTAAVARR